MKKIILIALALILVLLPAACAGDGEPSAVESATESSSSAGSSSASVSSASESEQEESEHEVSEPEESAPEPEVPYDGIRIEEIGLDAAVTVAPDAEPFTLPVTLSPENASGYTLLWTSSNEAIATVNQLGLVTVVSEGRCLITVSEIHDMSTAKTLALSVAEPADPAPSAPSAPSAPADPAPSAPAAPAPPAPALDFDFAEAQARCKVLAEAAGLSWNPAYTPDNSCWGCIDACIPSQGTDALVDFFSSSIDFFINHEKATSIYLYPIGPSPTNSYFFKYYVLYRQ